VLYRNSFNSARRPLKQRHAERAKSHNTSNVNASDDSEVLRLGNRGQHTDLPENSCKSKPAVGNIANGSASKLTKLQSETLVLGFSLPLGQEAQIC
jgi:hypothetical protein